MMHTRKLLFLGAAFALMLPTLAMADPSICDAIAGNLVTNCGFETGDFTGWTQGGNTGFTGVDNAGFGDGLAPNSGNFFAYLGPVGSDGTLSQSLATTAGDSYVVSFYLAADGGTPSDFSVQWGGSTIFSVNPVPLQGYNLYSFTEAAGGATTLQFNFRNDPGYLGLDDVSVVQSGTVTPEPGYWALLSMAIVGLIWVKRRRATVAA
jgi:hypothetical protein